MQITPSWMPAHAATAKSPPLSRARKNSTGPVIHGRPISRPPTVGPQRRAASDITATSIGGTVILRRKKSIGSGKARREEAGDLFACPVRGLAVREMPRTLERGQIEVGEQFAEPVAPGVAQDRVQLAPAHARWHG